MDRELLFTPFQIGKCNIKNRYAMVAMGTGGMVNVDGTFNERGIEYYIERARGGVGIIITGTMYVENNIEKVLPGVMPFPTLNPNRFIINSSELTERVHAYDCKIFAQLTAGFGRVMTPHLLMSQPVSASCVESFWGHGLMCRELSIAEIHDIVEKCAVSALICKSAGYDGVEIHAVHEGYLLDQFAISLFNHRTDEYGCSLENRLRFACEIVKRIKEKCGADFPVALRYSLKSFIKENKQGGLPNENFVELGRDIEEGLQAAKILEAAGYDSLDLDSGSYEAWYWAHPPVYHEEGLNITYGKMVKEVVDIPVILAGRMQDPEIAMKALESQAADIIGLGRALLADAEVVKKIKTGKLDNVRTCLGCHEGCMHRLVSSKSMSCAVNPVSGREKAFALQPLKEKKSVLIVGAGIAGLEAARVLSTRGHEVHIYEKEYKVGGLICSYCDSKYKAEYKKLINWYAQEMIRLKVDIHYNQIVTETNVYNTEYDIIIIATGSKPKEFSNIDRSYLSFAQDAIQGKVDLGNKVAIIGGGLVGCELALDLVEKGKDVTILESTDEVLHEAGIPIMNKNMLLDLLKINQVEMIINASVKLCSDHNITYVRDQKEHTLAVDNVISSIGYQSENILYHQLLKMNKEVYAIGDAKNVKNIMYAIWDAYELCNNL